MAPKRKRQQDSPEPKKVKTSGIPSVDVLRSSLDSYSVLLKSRSQEHTNKPDELADLDTFVHDELPPRIDDGVSLDDFAKVIRWKLLRGKFRPLLSMFLKNNAEDGVRDCTRRAASILHNKSTKDPVEALKPLVEMKGVGPATASAYLALFPDGVLPFFSDELAECFADELGPIKYTEAYYKKLVVHMNKAVDKANKETLDDYVWTAAKMEKAVWAWKYTQNKEK